MAPSVCLPEQIHSSGGSMDLAIIDAQATTTVARHHRSARHIQVVICGAGPVGLFAGIVLASHGVQVRILEALPSPSDSPRAVGCLPVAISELIEANVYDTFRTVANESSGFTFWSGDGLHKERLAVLPKLEGIPVAFTCGQPTFVKVLLSKLETFPNAEISFDCKVIRASDDPEQGPVRVVYESSQGNTSQITCDWLIGADGSRSTVRKSMDIEFAGFTWPKEEFVATDVLYPFSEFDFTSGNFFVDPVNWGVVAAINPKVHLWRIAYGAKPGMSVEEHMAEAQQRILHFLPDRSIECKLVHLSPYKVHQRCAVQLRKGRVLLIGDAAHSNNPMGGLGLTSGLLDAGPLGRALSAVLQGRAPESLLDTWAMLRHKAFSEYTNPQSIENKRVVQRGGYGEDPANIWAQDAIAEAHGMTKWLQKATPEAKEHDMAMFHAMADESIRSKAVTSTWAAALAVDWMAEYESEETLTVRRAMRPQL
ncbi:hypothetical protein BU17DRAFT_79911 [Hysterangium stoloniferum]|nr:hypothetical protein BU17DRAFT_79911 [Hysterangium stoloniferum]